MNDLGYRISKTATKWSIADNPDPQALYDPLIAGVNIWATPQDHPQGEEWKSVLKYMDTGAYTKRCAFVGTAHYNHLEGVIELDTDAYIFMDHLGMNWQEIANRPADIAWAKDKIAWLFKKMGVPCPQIVVTKE